MKRAKWSENDLRAALEEAKEGICSARAASRKYGIPRSTLRNHIKSGTTEKRLGRTPVLQMHYEEELVSRIVRFAMVGMPITNDVIKRSVYTFCKEKCITNPFNKDTAKAGRKWCKEFLGRNPGIVPRRGVFPYQAQPAKLNRVIVQDYFKKLNAVMTELGVHDKPQCIYNMDEMGCRFTLHNHANLPPKVRKPVNLAAPGLAENIEIITCGNACGQSIPPFILVKGKRNRLKDDWADDLPVGTRHSMAPEGFMTTAIFAKWLQHFSKFKVNQGPTLLIFDSTSSHLDACVVTEADKYNITLICLPNNCTRQLQPLRKGFFKSFESYWDAAILNYCEVNPNEKVTLANFGSIFKTAWAESMTISNLTDAFKATGVYPFNESAIPDEAYIPAHLTKDTDLGPPIVDCRVPFIDCNSPMEDCDVNFVDGDIPVTNPSSTAVAEEWCAPIDHFLKVIYNDHSYS